MATLRTSPCGRSTLDWPALLSVLGKSSAIRGGLLIEKPPGWAAGGAFIWMRKTVVVPDVALVTDSIALV